MVGLDIARGVAILGMFIAHAIPRPDDAELLVDGRSSILFATLAGVSLGLMTGGARPVVPGQRRSSIRSIAIRAFVLFLLGSALWLTGSEIAIILDYYAIMFLLLLPVLFAPRWVIAVVAAALAIGAPLVAAELPAFDSDAVDIASVAASYLLNGYYPALVWLPFLCVGLIAARSDVRRPGTQYVMVGGGLACAALGYGAAALLPGIDAAAHSGSTAELFGSGGLAIAVIGILVWAASRPRPAGNVVRSVTWPIAAAGSMALSVYTVQILILAGAAAVRDATGGALEYPGYPLLIVMTVVTVAGASVWKRYLGRGPLERMLTAITTPRRRRPLDTTVPQVPEWETRPSPSRQEPS